ncbi:hypothetical protein J3R83DRAFT_223 [Lanmaoa asiatica]|nr:hypothetical protein J3R83DRAFT_223 [Lanmaoa asiatica]
MGAISAQLFVRAKEKEEGLAEGEQDKFIIGLLVKAGNTDSGLRMTPEEVVTQLSVEDKNRRKNDQHLHRR